MELKKIIPCLDFKDGRVVKGIKFLDVKEVGDPVTCAIAYCEQGADELAMLDISATTEGRGTMLSAVENVAKHVTIPFCVGGGIRSVQDATDVLNAGASKVSVGSAAVARPALLRELIEAFDDKRIVLGMDAGKGDSPSGFVVFTGAGQVNTGIDAAVWARQAADAGIKEILLTSTDRDGTKAGYDLALTKLVAQESGAAVTASGGAGNMQDIYDALVEGEAAAALAASLFHYGEINIRELKQYLKDRGVNVAI